MKRKIALVTWLDSTSDSGWSYGDRDTELTAIHSIGFIVKVNKRSMTITSTLASRGEGKLDTLTIPLGAILKVTKINVADRQFSS